MKKTVFYLPFFLTALLITSCDHFKRSSNISLTSEQATEIDIFADALPPLSDIETWPLPLAITYHGQNVREYEEENENEELTSVTETESTSADFNIFSDGFKMDGEFTMDEETKEYKRYCYHADGVTYEFTRAPNYEDDDEMMIETWETYDDIDEKFYNSMLDDFVLEILYDYWWTFATVYELFSRITDENALEELALEMAGSYFGEIDLELRFYQSDGQYILKLNYEYIEYDEQFIGEEMYGIAFDGDRAGRLFVEDKQTADEFARLHRFDISFMYTDNRPAYSGPFMAAD